MQRRDGVGRLRFETPPQQLTEEMVVAIPAAVPVERDEKEVGPLELLEPRSGIRIVRHGRAERRAEPPENRGPQKEQPQMLGQAVDHFRSEVVDDTAVVARERRDEPPGIRMVAQRKPGELQPYRRLPRSG